ncbi:hypothetical protein F5148DRAFT_176686 [Russula earlei]|uniref:Uncharacterized protein n=1 Tax=Russula earlei TaxID=71964 RepID=A0ACC0U656_9AGAM|nr:hypothetical protein F5148DRAFT_176686 [Russula earlei]
MTLVLHSDASFRSMPCAPQSSQLPSRSQPSRPPVTRLVAKADVDPGVQKGELKLTENRDGQNNLPLPALQLQSFEFQQISSPRHHQTARSSSTGPVSRPLITRTHMLYPSSGSPSSCLDPTSAAWSRIAFDCNSMPQLITHRAPFLRVPALHINISSYHLKYKVSCPVSLDYQYRKGWSRRISDSLSRLTFVVLRDCVGSAIHNCSERVPLTDSESWVEINSGDDICNEISTSKTRT